MNNPLDNTVAAISTVASALLAPVAIATYVNHHRNSSFSSAALNYFCFSRIIHDIATVDGNNIARTFFLGNKKLSLKEKLSADNLVYSEMKARKESLKESATMWAMVSAGIVFGSSNVVLGPYRQGTPEKEFLEVACFYGAAALSGLCWYRSMVKDTVELDMEDAMLLKEVNAVTEAEGEGVIIVPEPRQKSNSRRIRATPVTQFTAKNPHDGTLWTATCVKIV